MEFIKTAIPDLLILKPKVFGDERGYFFESWRDEWFEEAGIDTKFVQDNESSSHYGVIRGLHFQRPPHAQAKLVRVIRGRVLDVAVDLRKGSPTYGKHVAVELTEDNHRQFFIPHGFAHGFAVLSDQAVFTYKCDDYYHPECEDGVAWDDPDLAIDWKIKPEDAIVSEKDKKNSPLQKVKSISL
ncbi:MAG: dTDP-4-dehydrorhamnose 3,5-epimerase [Bacteroidales bacterium]